MVGRAGRASFLAGQDGGSLGLSGGEGFQRLDGALDTRGSVRELPTITLARGVAKQRSGFNPQISERDLAGEFFR